MLLWWKFVHPPPIILMSMKPKVMYIRHHVVEPQPLPEFLPEDVDLFHPDTVCSATTPAFESSLLKLFCPSVSSSPFSPCGLFHRPPLEGNVAVQVREVLSDVLVS
jgi:hypothetical protein